MSAVVTDTDESISDLEESISDGTDEYLPSETKSESGDSMMGTGHQNDDIGLVFNDGDSADEEEIEEAVGGSAATGVEINDSMHTSTTEIKGHEDQNVFLWSTNISNLKPRMNLPFLSDPTILADVNRSSTELEVFFKLFPKSLFEETANYTNMLTEELIKILKHETKRFKTLDCTSPEEILVVLGCVLVMSYNRLPAIYMYWSTSPSLGNALIKTAIARDRFQILYSNCTSMLPKNLLMPQKFTMLKKL